MTAEEINNDIASGETLNINTSQIPLEEVYDSDPAIGSGELVNYLSLVFETTPLTA